MQGKGSVVFLTVVLCLTWAGVRGEYELQSCTPTSSDDRITSYTMDIIDGKLLTAVLELSENVNEKLTCDVEVESEGNVITKMQQEGNCPMQEMAEAEIGKDFDPKDECEGYTIKQGRNVMTEMDVSPLLDNANPGEGTMKVACKTDRGDFTCVECTYQKY